MLKCYTCKGKATHKVFYSKYYPDLDVQTKEFVTPICWKCFNFLMVRGSKNINDYPMPFRISRGGDESIGIELLKNG